MKQTSYLFKFFKGNADNKLLESIEYSFTNGGKRLRPVLALMTADAITRKEDFSDIASNPALGLALAVELVHCGSLVHDDLPCMDDDELRRGKPTNHVVYGEDMALLTGDYLLVQPISVFIDYSQNFLELDPALVLQVGQKLLEAVQKMILGQAMDLDLAKQKISHENQVAKELYFEQSKLMQEYKTGALLSAAITNAAMLAKASDTEISSLEKYARNLGLAFQIADDVLDYTSTTEEMGKKTGKDLEQNKLTYVDIYGLEKAQEIAKELIGEAKEILRKTSIYSDKLELIADYVVSRRN